MKKRTIEQREHDLVTVAELYLGGWLQSEIADELKVNQSTVSRDIAEIHQRWIDAQIDTMNEKIRHELAVINRAEQEAWTAWKASKEPLVTRRSSGKAGEKITEAQKEIEDRVGDPRYLATVLKCVDMRMDLLGLKKLIVEGTVDHTHSVRVDRMVSVFQQMDTFDRGLLEDGGIEGG